MHVPAAILRRSRAKPSLGRVYDQEGPSSGWDTQILVSHDGCALVANEYETLFLKN